MNNETAFPTLPQHFGYSAETGPYGTGAGVGLTKREWFAGQALPFALHLAFANLATHLQEVNAAGLSNDDAQDAVFDCARNTAYAIADKMLSTEAAHDER